MVSPSKHIVYFDGFCVLCNGSVDLLLAWDKHKVLHFATNASESYEREIGDLVQEDSIVLLSNGVIYTKSSAVFRIAGLLPFPYKALVVFRVLPTCLSDQLYQFIAKIRYKVFGKRESCRMPSEDEKQRFLS